MAKMFWLRVIGSQIGLAGVIGSQIGQKVWLGVIGSQKVLAGGDWVSRNPVTICQMHLASQGSQSTPAQGGRSQNCDWVSGNPITISQLKNIVITRGSK